MTSVFFFVFVPLEIVLMAFFCWALLNEQKFIDVEVRLMAQIKVRRAARARSRRNERTRRTHEKTAYTPVKPSGKRGGSEFEAA